MHSVNKDAEILLPPPTFILTCLQYVPLTHNISAVLKIQRFSYKTQVFWVCFFKFLCSLWVSVAILTLLY